MVSDWRRDHHDALDWRPNYRQSDHWWDIRSGTLNLLVPLAVRSWALRGRLVIPPEAGTDVSNQLNTTPFEQNTIFFMGIAALLTVPVFKAVTHLPPFMGILLNLGVLWLAGELIHRRKSDDEKEHLVLAEALQRIDMPSKFSSLESYWQYQFLNIPTS